MLEKNENFTLIKLKGIFYIASEYKFYEVNETAARIYNLCNGNNTVNDIATKMSKKFDLNYSETLNEVIEFTDSLLSFEVLKNG